MTIIELFWFLLRIGLVIWVGMYGWRVGAWAGMMIGSVVGFFIIPVVIWMLEKCFPFKRRVNPTCKNGKCGDIDYKWVGGKDGRTLLCRCKCGNDYTYDGNRFMSVDKEGKKEPFMVWKRKNGWVKDEGAVKRVVF